MSIIKVPYHKSYRNFTVPDGDILDIVKPSYAKYENINGETEQKIISSALANPIDKPKLENIVDKSSNVAIIVDDNTRPTPTERILPLILKKINKSGVKDQNITIIFFFVFYRKLSVQEEKKLLGNKIWNKYRIIQHESRNKNDLIKLSTSNKKINKWAYNADLRIMIGFIKSHDIAGYSGGAKSILPGLADYNTILNNHSFTNLSDSATGIGILAGNPCREEMEKMALAVEPNFIINVVLNRENKVIKAVAGDVISAHRTGVKLYNEIAMVKVDKMAHIVMACCPYPTDSNLYQALYGAAVTFKVSHPIVKKGGVIILVAHCPEGIGDESFTKLIMDNKKPDQLISTISKENFSQLGQWAGQLWADLLNYANVILVSGEKIPDSYFAQTPMKKASSLNKAWEMGKNILGENNIRGYFLPQAPLTLPLAKND